MVGAVDPFEDLLRGVRAEGGTLTRVELSAGPVYPESVLALLAPLRGHAVVTVGGRRQPVRDTESAVVRGPFAVAGEGTLLVADYQVRGEVSRRLLDVLPPVLVVPDDDDGCHRDYLDTCIDAGPQVVLDRMLDLSLVCRLRAWVDQPSSGWFRALADPVVGPVVRAMHAAPERPWTLAALAGEAGVSRTTMTGRFTKLVGHPPLTYLTEWRMALAADLLTGTTATVAAVARRVGYADAFGFSSAFKRVHGASPTWYRRHCAGVGCAEAAEA